MTHKVRTSFARVLFSDVLVLCGCVLFFPLHTSLVYFLLRYPWLVQYSVNLHQPLMSSILYISPMGKDHLRKKEHDRPLSCHQAALCWFCYLPKLSYLLLYTLLFVFLGFECMFKVIFLVFVYFRFVCNIFCKVFTYVTGLEKADRKECHVISTATRRGFDLC